MSQCKCVMHYFLFSSGRAHTFSINCTFFITHLMCSDVSYAQSLGFVFRLKWWEEVGFLRCKCWTILAKNDEKYVFIKCLFIMAGTYLKIRFWGAYNILICPSFEEIRAKYVPPPHVPTFIFCGQNKCVASSHHIAHWKILNLSSLFLLILLIIICPLLIYFIIIFYFLFSGKPKFTCFSFQNQYFVVDFRLSII